MDRESKLEKLGMVLMSAGAAASAAAVSRRHGRSWALALGGAFITAGLLYQRASRALPALAPRSAADDAIDAASAASFPASDPPSISAAELNR